MVRRRIAELPTSRLAIWSRRIALFSLVTTLIAVIVVRSGALEIVPALSTLGGALVLAVVAILLAFGAGISIWIDGIGGLQQAIVGFLIGAAIIAYPAYLGVKAYRLPAIYDVTTDPIDPPRFEAIARVRPRDAHPVAYAGLYTAELQHAAYSDIEPDLTDSSPLEAYNAALKIITKRKWHIVDQRPPQDGTTRDGRIEAIARTPILGFREDVAVRIRRPRTAPASTCVPPRVTAGTISARSRAGAGADRRYRRVLAAGPDKKQPVPKPPQAAGKGTSARR